ncbi:Ubiquitin fusion degradation protein 1 [Mycena kentingensis (nom. inval.)]|nr:Ubiquitin fusion degradation protein 1 [Mycena kentingensis (nom. inval.)]
MAGLFGGPQGFMAHLAGAGGFHHGHGGGPYDEYFKAYSVSFLPGKERDNVAYGGKIIMPPSALARLTALELPSPWIFQMRNPKNSAASTYASVLEFIAQEGTVCLPYWMMRALRLEDGDTIRLTEAPELPKGKFVKFQAQEMAFTQVSDPKAVLEQAMRNFSTLTQGDIIEIKYNAIRFGLLVMETRPAETINIHDTDLEVDFGVPVGYVEPERPKAAPPQTMASKLKIDLNSSSPGSSRPGSSLGGGFAGPSQPAGVSKSGEEWESFKGKGETLAGRKTKGKGISVRAAEGVDEASKIYRTDQHRIVNNESLERDVKVPAALNLPFGQLFFGFNVTAYVPPASVEPSSPAATESAAFSGSGNTLNGRQTASTSAKGKEKEKASEQSTSSSWATLSGPGNTLGASVPRHLGPVGAGGASVPRVPQRNKSKVEEKERSPTPDFGVDDDDIMDIDSD